MPKTPINKAAPDWWPDEAMPICRLSDMPEGAARGFTLENKKADKEGRQEAVEKLGGKVNLIATAIAEAPKAAAKAEVKTEAQEEAPAEAADEASDDADES